MQTPLDPKAEVPRRPDDLIWGALRLQLVCAAVELGIIDALIERPRATDELAAAIGIDVAIARRLVRAWRTLGLLDVDGERLQLTALGRTFRRGAPSAGWAVQWSALYYAAFAQLVPAVKTGESAFRRAFGTTPWEWRRQHPELDQSFNQLMEVETRLFAPLLLAAFDFAGARRVVDVGGGAGVLLRTLLATHGELRGVLFDLPNVVEPARHLFAQFGDRCEVVGGDVFAGVPPGGDVYVLKNVLHNWPDDRAELLLRRCRAAMSPGHRLLVVDALLFDDRPDHAQAVWEDLRMLVMHQGAERTERRFRELLEPAGFAIERITPLEPTALYLIEATPTTYTDTLGTMR